MNALILMVTHYMYSRDAARVTTSPNDGAVIAESFYATRIDPPKGGSMILVTMYQYVCMYVCMYVCIFIKLHITAQSGPVIRVILCHSH